MGLLPAALQDFWDFLAPHQLATGIPSGMDAIDHEACALMNRNGHDPDSMVWYGWTRQTSSIIPPNTLTLLNSLRIGDPANELLFPLDL